MNLDLGPGYLPAYIAEEVLPVAPVRPAEGIHDYLFTLARVLHPWRTEEQISGALHAYARQCGRHVPETEIAASIRRAKAYAWNGQTRSSAGSDTYLAQPAAPPPAEPQFSLEAFRRFIAGIDNVDAEWLAARSPICPWNRTPASFLHALYRPGEKVIIFDDYHSQGQEAWAHPGLPYDARALNRFAKGKPCGVWFLSCPVDGLYHRNDDGKQSRRSHQSVTAWRFLLLESDRADIAPAQWLAALVFLPLPIVSICETGGRLAHALVRVDAPSKDAWDRTRDELKPVLTAIGADTHILSAVRLCRLPCCERLGKEGKDGKYEAFAGGPHHQRLLYLNPFPDGTTIAQQSTTPTNTPDDAPPKI
jgi:hypothetical protein